VIYIAAPYSHEKPYIVEARVRVIAGLVGKIMEQGQLPICPLLGSHIVAEVCSLRTDFDFWQRLDREVIRHCEQLWVLCLEGWDRSISVRAEIEWAEKCGIPVRWIDPSTLDPEIPSSQSCDSVDDFGEPRPLTRGEKEFIRREAREEEGV
jgi:hypothetical protein